MSEFSKSHIVRLIKAGAVEFDGEVVKDPNLDLEVYSIIRIGKKKWVRRIFYRGKVKDLIYEVTK